MKEDLGPPPPHPPHKRRQLEQSPAIWLAIWADNKDGVLTPSELRRVKEERERRKNLVVEEVLGFTGTRAGVTPQQKSTVRALIETVKPVEVHHGDCVGADEWFHKLCFSLHIPIIGHPPEDARQRAWCRGFARVEPSKPFLVRNKDIVRVSTRMVGTPKEMHEPPPQRGQGTWSTIRFARDRGMRPIVVMPDGRLDGEKE